MERGGFPVPPPPRVRAVRLRVGSHVVVECRCPYCGRKAPPPKFFTPDRTCRGCGRMLRVADEIVDVV